MLKGLVALVVLDTNVFAPDVMEVLDPISTDRVHLWQALCRFRAAAADVCANALMNAGSIYIGRGWCALEGDATRVSGYALDKYSTVRLQWQRRRPREEKVPFSAPGFRSFSVTHMHSPTLLTPGKLVGDPEVGP